MSNLSFLTKFAGGEVAKSWLRKIIPTRGYATGASLELALDNAGVIDPGYRAEQWLREFEALGWLQRGNPQPSREAKFFGLGGMLADACSKLSKDPSMMHMVSPRWYAWGFADPSASLPDDLIEFVEGSE